MLCIRLRKYQPSISKKDKNDYGLYLGRVGGLMVIRGGGKPPSNMPSWLCHCVGWVTCTPTLVGSLKWAG